MPIAQGVLAYYYKESKAKIKRKKQKLKSKAVLPLTQRILKEPSLDSEETSIRGNEGQGPRPKVPPTPPPLITSNLPHLSFLLQGTVISNPSQTTGPKEWAQG